MNWVEYEDMSIFDEQNKMIGCLNLTQPKTTYGLKTLVLTIVQEYQEFDNYFNGKIP